MDSIDNKLKEDASNNTQSPPNMTDDADTPSRFSRRRFIQTGAVASPILLAVKSPVAWGNALSPETCSVTALMSGNASHPQNCLSGAKSPGYWHKVFKSDEGDTHYVVRTALNKNSIFETQTFNEFFLSGLGSWQTSSTHGWKFRVSASQSDNPQFQDVLPENKSNKFDLTLEFEKIGDPSNKHSVNISAGVPNFHKFVLAGYLNSLFNPAVISYSYYPEQVKQALNVAIIESAYKIMPTLSKSRRSAKPDTSLLVELRDALNEWDS